MKRIMVPTDGSPESEKAVPIAQQIARAQNAEVVLIHVLQPIALEFTGVEAPADPDLYETLLQSMEGQARADLDRLRTSLESDSVRARWLAPRGFAASTLLDYERKELPDLLVMATHGRTGLARFALGSVADRLVREGTVPVLLVRRETPADATMASAIVMLDGSDVAERALPVVEQLAGKPLRSITLFRAVMEPDERGTALAYLKTVAARFVFADAGVEMACTVAVGDPRQTVAQIARGHDLVILATHGRGGFDRLRHGSVAEAIVRELENPTLLVRASG
jgi:nucleotide-binding universal stress UspA family protein